MLSRSSVWNKTPKFVCVKGNSKILTYNCLHNIWLVLFFPMVFAKTSIFESINSECVNFIEGFSRVVVPLKASA